MALEQLSLRTCQLLSLCHFVEKDVFGLRRESSVSSAGSVEVAVAVLLAVCIIVVLTILGYCFFKNQTKNFHSPLHQPPPTPASSTVSTTEDTEHLVYNHTTQPL